jgi:endoglucanase
MNFMHRYQAGVNLGGWLSQYKVPAPDHFETFITEKDIEQIASWGMDHVRLPIDYHIITDEDNPLGSKENGFAHIEQCLEWCKKNHLNMVLDMHKVPGFSFNTLESNSLFSDEGLQKKFIELWMEVTGRFIRERDNLVFELLNEVVDTDSTRWNSLARKTIASIRGEDRDRRIIIGSNCYGIVSTLCDLEIHEDPNIIYSFHFYEPFFFTHQKAPFSKMHAAYNTEVGYPGEYAGLREFLETHREFERFSHLLGKRPEKRVIDDLFVHVRSFMKKAPGKNLYCGEYGVIDAAPTESSIRWHRDFADIMKELKIGRAVWSYKNMNFGLVDKDGKVASGEVVKITSEKFISD